MSTMHPMLASALINILRWLQFIATKDLALLSEAEQAKIAASLLEDTTALCQRLTSITLLEHRMLNNNKQSVQ